MCTVRGAKCVIHIHIAELSQLFSKTGVAFLLFLVKTEVFQKEHLARLQRRSLGISGIADAIVRKLHIDAQYIREMSDNMFQRELFRAPFFRPTQVRHQDDRPAIVQNLLDGRCCSSYAVIVCNGEMLIQGYVEVYPYQCFFSGKIEIVYGSHVNYNANDVRGTKLL